MVQPSGQRKNKSFLSTLKNKLTVNALIVVGTLLMLGVLIYIIIWLLMHQYYVWAGMLAFITFGGFVLLGYSSRRFEWVGLKAYKKIGTTTGIARPPRKIIRTEEDQPRKTLWDWLQLLIIPAVLVGATIFFNNAQTQNSINAAQDQQHEDVLVNYEKDISDLLLNQQQQNQQQQLGSYPPGEAVRAVARARTLTALNALNLNHDSALILNHDNDRKKLLVRFLYDAHLIITRNPIVDLHNADLSDVDLSGTEQNKIDLSRINLTGANLTGVKLKYTNLNGAYLDGDLTHTTFTGADLSSGYLWNADLSKVDFTGADLSGADLSRTIMIGVNLSRTNLAGTNLAGADLSGANLTSADLTGADLSGANLQNAIVDVNNLKKEARLSNTILPDKSITSADPTPSTTCKSTLGDDSSQWHISLTDTTKKVVFSTRNVSLPNIDPKRNPLQISLLGGQQYAGIQAYRTLPLNHQFQTFELCLNFYLTDSTPIQALGFSMQQWVINQGQGPKYQEWEWALQWQNIGDGTTQQGAPPNWRIWTGNGKWQNTNTTQNLIPGRWHTLDFIGNIVKGQLQYGVFKFDDTPISLYLGQNQFNPVSISQASFPGNQLVVAVQLDGNSQEDPYDVYLDNINFTCNNMKCLNQPA